MSESSPFCHLPLLTNNFSPQTFSCLFTCNIPNPTFFTLINSIEPSFLAESSLSGVSNLIFVVGHIFRREFGPRLACPPDSVCGTPGDPLSITLDHWIVQIVQTVQKEIPPLFAFPEKCLRRHPLLHVNLIFQYSKPLSFVEASN